MRHLLQLKSAILHWKLWQFWAPQDLLNTVPPPLWPWMPEYLAVLILLLIGAVLSLAVRMPGRLNERLGALCWNNLWLGALLFFFRYQHVPILGMDIWRFLQELVIIIWLYRIVRNFLRTYPQQRLAERVAEYRGKYLPKPKMK